MKSVSGVLRDAAFALALLGIESSLAAAPGEVFTPIDPAAQTAAMARGVNVLGYDPVWQDPSKARFTPAMFKKIHDAGFSNVRIVLQTFEHLDANNELDAKWLATLDVMVAAAYCRP